jgi:DNA-binding CsgD family transcriptional regulator
MDRPNPGTYRLTLQEHRLLVLLFQGHHRKTAADAMGVSVNTVSFHLKNVYCKLGVHSKTEAVVKGLLEGLLAPEYARTPPLRAG